MYFLFIYLLFCKAALLAAKEQNPNKLMSNTIALQVQHSVCQYLVSLLDVAICKHLLTTH